MSICGAHFKLALLDLSNFADAIGTFTLQYMFYVYILHFAVDVPVICYPLRNLVLEVASEQCRIYPSESIAEA